MSNPWDAVSALDRMLDDVMGSAFGAAVNARTFSPTIDVYANDDEVVFLCDVPGISENELDVTLENHVLTIEGERRFERGRDDQVVLGRPYGAFRRSFSLPDSLDEANLSADLANGVLTIRIPKHPKAKPRKIPITGTAEVKQLTDKD